MADGDFRPVVGETAEVPTGSADAPSAAVDEILGAELDPLMTASPDETPDPTVVDRDDDETS